MKDQDQSVQTGVTIFLCGDVMTGRGLDQIMPHSVDPAIYESYVKDARDYVRLAEIINGPIYKPVSWPYIWGDAIRIWKQMNPDCKIINLETTITSHNLPWPGKGINYRMHPGNIKVLTSAGIDFCSLANNHVLDWGNRGLQETIQTLKEAGIAYSGAGIDLNEAGKPAHIKTGQSEVIIFSFGTSSSGIPRSWGATLKSSGVNLIDPDDDETIEDIKRQLKSFRKPGTIVIVSIHWGSNWGYDISESHSDFAQKLIDIAGVDIVYGHSSHHPKGIEVYKDKLILYGAGDFINDYEGISGYERYRDDLSLMYFPKIDPSDGSLVSMILVPMKIKNFRLNRVSDSDAEWLRSVLNREGEKLGTSFILNQDHYFSLHWDRGK